jgi:hypothetical protein
MLTFCELIYSTYKAPNLDFKTNGRLGFSKEAPMSLKHLSNQELITSTKRALQVMRESEVTVLRHFQEIEDRKLWVEAGSIYKYIALTFGLTDDQIYPRLQAMRLMRTIPEVEQRLEDGRLTVTNMLKAQQVFVAESKSRAVSLKEKREVVESLERSSTKQADKILAIKCPESKKPVEKVKPVAENRNLVQFYVDDETLKQIEDLKAKFSHQMPSGRMEDLIKILIGQATRQSKPRKRVEIRTRSRYIPAEVKREMEKTRKEGCSHVDKITGRRCASKHFLQVDHIHEYGRGGSNETPNLQWLCGFHNRHRFETSREASRAHAGQASSSPRRVLPL